MMGRVDGTYLETLCLYYEEEIEGEAYFAALASAFDDPDHVAKLTLLAEVERHAARAVAPLIARHRLAPRDTTDLIASGQAEARATRPDWSALMAGMADTYPGYLDAFRRLEAMAPPEDLSRLAFLTQHEVAALEFLDCERRNPAHSADPLRAYLASTPGTGSAAATG